MSELLNLTGQLLIAMPGMEDSRFERSVIMICAHAEDGAMGLMLNKPAPNLTMGTLYDQLSIEASHDMAAQPVHSGGPVERERGFVLHSSEYRSAISSLPVGEDYAMTATLDILEDIAAGRGPTQASMMLGYCGWGPGQLEAELAENGWLVGLPTPELIFGNRAERKWNLSLTAQGIDPLTLSAAAGRA